MPEPGTRRIVGRRRLRRADYAMGSVELARALLGRRLVRVLDDGTRLSGIIVETEAYLGAPDKAAHSYNGRRTARTEPMFGPPGTAYVYFTYGMHHCMNVAAGEEGNPVAVLLRALEPEEGQGVMAANRRLGERAGVRGGGREGWPVRPGELCGGPGKLCQALAITRDFSGIDLTTDPSLYLEQGWGPVEAGRLVNTARIGVGGAAEWADARLRWFVAGNPHVSG